MPKELKSIDDINDKLLDRTLVVYTKRSGENVKFKFRTKKTLYTLVTSPAEADKIERSISGQGRSIDIIPK